MSFYFLHRGWMDHHLFRDQPYSEREAWVYLIEKANFEPSIYRQAGNLFTIPRGDHATSYRTLAEKWKWSTNKAIRFLKLLISDLMISVKTEHNFVWITICNYEVYQNPLAKKETDSEQQRNTDGTATDTDSNTNVITKELNKDTPPKPPPKTFKMPFSELPDEWKQWAIQERSWPDNIMADVWADFHEYWTIGNGKATKRGDWFLSWRKWVRKESYQSKGTENAANRTGFNQGAQLSKSERARRAFQESAVELGYAGKQP
jgi:hypothetical protein